MTSSSTQKHDGWVLWLERSHARRPQRDLNPVRGVVTDLGRIRSPNNSEIAGQSYLRVCTVQSHRADIQRQTGRFTRFELVRYAFDDNLVE